MADDPDIWLGLQRERTRLAWNRTLEALTAAQVVVTADGLRTHRAGPSIAGMTLLIITLYMVWWQYRTSHEDHGGGSTPAARLAVTCAALGLLALGGLLITLR